MPTFRFLAAPALLLSGLLQPRIAWALHVYSSATINGSSNLNDSGLHLALDSGGNLYASGAVRETVGAQNAWIGKYNTSLVLQASVTANGAIGGDDWANGLAFDTSNNVFVTGGVDDGVGSVNIWLAKYSPSLVLLASATFSGPSSGIDEGFQIALDAGGNVYVAGYVFQGGAGTNIWLGKYNSSLVLQSSYTFDGPAFSNDYANALRAGGANIYACGSVTEAAGAGGQNVWLAKFDASLVLQSSTTLNGSAGGSADACNDLFIDGAGNLYIIGGVVETTGGNNILFAKYNSSLALLSSATFNGPDNLTDSGYNLAGADANYLYAVGFTSKSVNGEHLWTARVSTSLVIHSSAEIDQREPLPYYSYGVAGDSVGNAYVAATLWNGSNQDVWIGKLVDLPVAPAPFAGQGIGPFSITWTWPDQNHENGYRVIDVSSANLSGNLAANTVSWTELGLSTNVSYTRSAAAFNTWGTSTSTVVSRFTLSAPPASTQITAVSSTNAALTWSVNTNPPGTWFEVSRSTDGFATQFSTPVALASSFTGANFTDAALTPEATYYFRVRSFNQDSVPSGFDLVQSTRMRSIPLVVPPTFSAVVLSTFSLEWSWLDQAGENGYRIKRATDAADLSGNLAAGTTFWIQTNLSLNTSQQAYVEAFNLDYTSVSVPLARHTRALPPTGTALSGVWITSATVGWGPNGNPSYTTFVVERSTTLGATYAFLASGPFSSLQPYTDTTLAAQTTYYYRLKAQNGDSVDTGYDNPVSTRTRSSPLATPGTLTGTALSTSSVQWTWLDISGEDGYRVRRTSDSFNLSGDLPANTLLWIQGGLSPNATQQVYLQAFNLENTSQGPSLTRFTRAYPPAGTSWGGVWITSAAVLWNLNGNPSYTTFLIERSTNGTAYSLLASGAYSVLHPYTDFGLSPQTTYYYKIKARNVDLVETFYDVVLTTRTRSPPLVPPASFSSTALSTTTLKWSWADQADEDGYRVRRATDNLNLSGDLPAGTTEWVQAGLAPNTFQQAYIQAFNLERTGATSALTRYTLANPPSGSAFSGIFITSLTVTWGLNGNPASTVFTLERSTDGAAFAAQAAGPYSTLQPYTHTGLAFDTTFYYRLRARNDDFIDTAYDVAVGTRTKPQPGPFVEGVIPASGDNLSQVVLTIVGQNFLSKDTVKLVKSGQADRILAAVTWISPLLLTGTADLLGATTGSWNIVVISTEGKTSGTSGDGRFTVLTASFPAVSITTITSSANVTIVTPGNTTRVDIPAGAMSDGTVFISVNPAQTPVVVNPSDIQAANTGIAATHLPLPAATREFVAFESSGVLRTAEFASDVTLEIPYPDADQNSVVDGTQVRELALKCMTLDPASKKWVEVPDSEVDTVQNRVRARVRHFSVYAVFVPNAASANLSQVRAYPNPWKPGSGGRSDAAFMMFDRLTDRAVIRIFTLLGELVKEIQIDPTHGGKTLGVQEWNGKNASGRDVASGVYIAHIKSSTGETRILKVAIER